jgi:hypothetical protein
MTNNKDKNSWLPNTNKSILKDVWTENLRKSTQEKSLTEQEKKDLLSEAVMVLSEDKNRPWNPFLKSEPKEEPTLGSPMKPLHKYKV